MEDSTTTAANRGSKKENQRGNYITTAHTQRLQILEHLRHDSLTTQQARLELCIMSPAPRVLELRRQGFNIVTEKTVYEDAQGKHSIAKYVLLAGGENG
jgi:hypothetical protein